MARRSARPVRLRGAVSLMNRAREQLKVGIPVEEQPAFREMITEGIRTIEAFCRQQRGKPERVLPTPSLKAYQFLKSIDLKHLPIPKTPDAVPFTPPRISGVVSKCNRYHRQFSSILPKWSVAATQAEQQAIIQPIYLRLCSDVDAIAGLCEEGAALPADLPRPSRSAFQWLAYLSNCDHLSMHLNALQALNALVVQEHLTPPKRYAKGVKQTLFKLYQSASLYRCRKRGNIYDVTLHEGFITADRDTLRALVHIVMGVGKTADQRAYKTFINTNTFAEVGIALALTTPPSPRSAQGMVYDLIEVFTRVNSTYFNGELEQPHLVWSHAHTRSKMGHYDPNTDTALISLTLDDKSVPRFYIDYVMYHELLHKCIGIKVVNGQRQAHTSEFHRLERQFKETEQVQAWLKREKL